MDFWPKMHQRTQFNILNISNKYSILCLGITIIFVIYWSLNYKRTIHTTTTSFPINETICRKNRDQITTAFFFNVDSNNCNASNKNLRDDISKCKNVSKNDVRGVYWYYKRKATHKHILKTQIIIIEVWLRKDQK